ncbi:DUF2017 family protein [Acidipropionibacterium timonense]|uniref:DUF2017 family protein n=1 Tax=Acidipropionibacterium timonense TaxID=2161818 RepID=UPI0010302E84|nr:DUF2017 family protein [Acidipropionibacterium timonense]
MIVERRRRGRWALRMDAEELAHLEAALDGYALVIEDVDTTTTAAGTPNPGPRTPDDPFAAWDAQLEGTLDSPTRLLADAFPDDPAANADFHAAHDAELLAGFRADLVALRADVETLRHGALTMDERSTLRWARTCSTMRVAIADQLGVIDEISARQIAEAAQEGLETDLHHMHEWLGALTEILIDVAWPDPSAP